MARKFVCVARMARAKFRHWDRVKGKRYFECGQNFGVFVKPDRVKVGDYPVEEINFDDEEI